VLNSLQVCLFVCFLKEKLTISIFIGGWVHDVSFSPSGNQLVYVSHDSSITIASGPTQPLQIIYTSYLPFTTCFWAGENAIVVAGHDCAPFIVSQQHRDAKWYVLFFSLLFIKLGS
jgi:hypothetical protein